MDKSAPARRFVFRPVPFIATVALVILGIVLGNWQTGRAAQKIALQQQLADAARQPPLALDSATLASHSPAQLAFRHVSMRGHFIDWPLALNNRPSNGRVGFYLVMPFELAGSHTNVLVARGWLPRNVADPVKLPPYPTPAGELRIEGVVKTDFGHVMQLGGADLVKPGAIVQNLLPAQFAQASGMLVAPVVVEQLGDARDGFVRDWPAPALGVEKHQGYAFQWYALAVMAALFFVITGYRRGSSSK